MFLDDATEFAVEQSLSAIAFVENQHNWKDALTSGASPRDASAIAAALLLVLLAHPLHHEVLNIPCFIPIVVVFDGLSTTSVCAGFYFHLVVVAQVALTRYMSK